LHLNAFRDIAIKMLSAIYTYQHNSFFAVKNGYDYPCSKIASDNQRQLKNLQQSHCSSICNALMMISEIIETSAICR